MHTRLSRIFVPLSFIFFVFSFAACDGLFGDLSELEAPELDVGNLDADDINDVDEGDTEADVDASCEPESDAEFCERLGHECGDVADVDNCGEVRVIDCDDHGDFGCGEEGNCLLADDIGALEANVCDCPDVDFNADSESICDSLEAECDEIDPVAICGYPWREVGVVDCGGCPDGEDCGLAGPNVCGCPCEIDGGCQDEGQPSDDNPCQICDPDQSREEYSSVDDGHECADNAICMDGACICDEDAGFTECGEQCVDTDSDEEHCGDCHEQCATDIDDAQAFCEDGDCIIECVDEDKTACLDHDICADLDDDDDHCGECGKSCADGEICDNGECICDGDEGYVDCGGQCVNTASHPDHCGGCSSSCEGDTLCVDGACQAECPSGQTECDNFCVDTESNIDHCGECNNPCDDDIDGASPDCFEGNCVYVCENSDEELCIEEEYCADLSSDVENCGACANECAGEEECINGVCKECENNSDCPEDHYCTTDYECVECFSDDDCGTDESCNTDSGICECDEVECGDDQCGQISNACSNTTDCGGCAAGYECSSDNVCEQTCTLTSDCSSGLVCVDGRCEECEDDSDCDDFCDSETYECVECTADEHCYGCKGCADDGNCRPMHHKCGDDFCCSTGTCSPELTQCPIM